MPVTWAFPPDPAASSRRPSRRRPGLGTDWGNGRGWTGDRSWTDDRAGAQPSRCPRVDTGGTLTTHSRPTGPFGRRPARTPVFPRIHTSDDEDEGVISRISRTTLWVGTLRSGVAGGSPGAAATERSTRGFPPRGSNRHDEHRHDAEQSAAPASGAQKTTTSAACAHTDTGASAGEPTELGWVER
jgi:hypothetical protein